MKRHKRFGNLENDCIAILAWAYNNQGKTQSYRILEEELAYHWEHCTGLSKVLSTLVKVTGHWRRMQKSMDIL